MPPSNDAQIWADYAEQDYRAMTVLLASADPVYPVSCFLAQQAVEKYLKAFLVFHGIDPQRSHDLNALRKQCALVDSNLNEFEMECAELNSYSVSPRYPMGIPRPGASEATRAASAAERIRAVIRQHIGM
jgi:HEPN domain-containing protein